LSFDEDFGDIFRDLDLFKLMRKSNSELQKIFEQIEKGEMKGTWEIRQIDEPEMKGYSIRGQFGLDKSLPSLESIEPLEPSRRRPSPNKPFDLPKIASREEREPLVDLFKEDKTLKIYVELQGVKKEDIKLKFSDGCVEVEANNFYKKIALPCRRLVTRATSIEYKNGLLLIEIPRAKQLRQKDAKNLKIA
jgi:HSP20 family molecular chaperone IbpA